MSELPKPTTSKVAIALHMSVYEGLRLVELSLKSPQLWYAKIASYYPDKLDTCTFCINSKLVLNIPYRCVEC